MDDVTSFFNEAYSPPTAFYFEVRFNGRPDIGSSFQEVSGLKLTFGTQEVREGGDNLFVHELPTQPTYSNLVLKRCLVLSASLDTWCKDAFDRNEFDPRDIHITLLGANGGSLASWNVLGAYPISWELASLDSTSNELAIETLELKYKHFKRAR